MQDPTLADIDEAPHPCERIMSDPVEGTNAQATTPMSVMSAMASMSAIAEQLSPADREILIMAKVTALRERLDAAMPALLDATSDFISITALRRRDLAEAVDLVDDVWRALSRLLSESRKEADPCG